MTPLRLLVTGAGGQVGREVVAIAASAGDAVTTFDGRAAVDLTDRAAVRAGVLAARPDVVVHCAAWTAVDACESDPGRAFAHNAAAVGHVADACVEAGARLVTVSTDYVFDGTKPVPYVEDDPVNPTSVYGRSKVAGEHEALARADSVTVTVARTSWVSGFHGSNMVKTILRLAGTPGPLRFVADQRGHPTFADDLALQLHRLAHDPLPGIVHVTNAGAVSWFEFAQAVLAAAGDDPGRVEPIATTDLVPARPAPRPPNSVLDNRNLRLVGRPVLDDFRRPLARLVAALKR